MPTWPSTLPQSPLVDGYGEEWGDVAIHTPQDEGPHKSRRRFTKSNDSIEWPMLLTMAQLATLRTFFYTDLAGGAVPFNLKKADGSTVSVKILEPPKPSPDNQYFRVSLKLLTM